MPTTNGELVDMTVSFVSDSDVDFKSVVRVRLGTLMKYCEKSNTEMACAYGNALMIPFLLNKREVFAANSSEKLEAITLILFVILSCSK